MIEILVTLEGVKNYLRIKIDTKMKFYLVSKEPTCNSLLKKITCVRGKSLITVSGLVV